MEKRFLKQYDPVADKYTDQIGAMNSKSLTEFKEALSLIKPAGNKVIELGCGAGDLIPYLQEIGYDCSGVDSSDEMVVIAKNATNADVRVEDFSNTTFESGSFDLAVSKWAIQTTNDIDAVYKETSRLLKKGGFLIFLVVHPIRQFLEKKKQGKDYFTQEIVESVIFEGTITVKEPSHTIADYFSDYFLQEFTLSRVRESYEFPGAEQINGDLYPTHLLFTAQKK